MTKPEELTRRQMRYWLFRFRTEETGGADAKDAPPGLRKKFEKLEGFTSWEEFADKWDIPTGANGKDLFKVVPRRWSVWEEWDRTLDRVARPLPKGE